MISQNIASQSIDCTELAYQDCVIKSGIDPIAFIQNLEPVSGSPIYDLFFRDKDKSTNSDSSSGSSLEASRNFSRCIGDPGYLYKGKFYLPSDLAGDMKAARFGFIKSEGEYWAGVPVSGWLTRSTGRFRQLAGPPIGFSKKKSKGFDLTTEFWEPRRYHQPKGKPLSFFFPTVSVGLWEAVAEKAGLPMPAFFELGLIDHPQLAKFIFCNNPIVSAALLMCGDASKFWEWVEYTNCPIVLTEGEKKALALISRGYAAIGLPGINTGYRVTKKGDWVFVPGGEDYQKAVERELKSELQKFDTPGREITILFDYREGDYSQSQEWKAATTTAKLLKSAIAKIAQLPGPDKGVDDFCVAGGDVDTVILAAPTFEAIEKQILQGLSKKNRKKAWALTYPIAWECHQRYLDIPYPDSGVICVRSPKGTGKTHALIKLVAKAHAEGRKVLLLTHRIVLGRAICKAVGIPWIEEMNTDGDRKIEGKAMGYGLCIDSLHPTSQAAFDPYAWENALIIFDEVEQVFWHALNSATCRENRQAILATLRVLLQSVLKSGGQVILQDADLSNFSIDFVKEFSGVEVNPWVAVNRYMPDEPWKIKFYDTYCEPGNKKLNEPGKKDDPSGLLRDAVKHVNTDGKIWLSCDSQKVKSKWGAKNLEKYLRSRCRDKKILRIDSETVANPEHEAYQCAEKIDGLAALYDIVICTPTLATGVSVDLRGHFTAVFGIFQGAIADNEVRQSLARVREAVPRYVWCRQIAVGSIGNGSANYRELQNSKTRDVRYNIHLLKDFDFDIDAATDPVVLRSWAKYGARVNTSICDFRDSVREGLEAEGHLIRSCSNDDAETGNQIKELRVINQVEEAIAVSQAEDIDEHKREELENQRSKTDAERYSEEKYDIKQIYQVEEVTPELRQLHQDRWYGKIQLNYLLTHNPDFLWMRDRKHFDGHIYNSEKGGDGKICTQDIRALTARIEIHKKLKTLQFTEPDREWTKDSPEVLEFVGKALKCAADIKDCLGIKVSPKKAAEDRIGIVNTFLKQLGFSLGGGEQRRVGGEQVRFYKSGGFAKVNIYDSKLDLSLNQNRQKIAEPEGLRSQIFEAWAKRDELALFEYLQKPVLIPESVVTAQQESAQNQGSSDLEQDLEPKTESVTPETINIVKESAVTTSPTVETPKQQDAGTGPASEKTWAWYRVKADWIKCRVLEFVSDYYLLEVKSMVDAGTAIIRAYPEDLRWEAPTC